MRTTLLALVAAGCTTQPVARDVGFDPAGDPAAYAANCEAPTASVAHHGEGMLPGRACLSCHGDTGTPADTNGVHPTKKLDGPGLVGQAFVALDDDGDEGDDGDGDGERFYAAGTVFATGTEPSCNAGGPSGISVEIASDDGTVQATTTSGRNGDFWFERALTFPIRVTLRSGTSTWTMPNAVTSGDCAACHDGWNVPRVNVGP